MLASHMVPVHVLAAPFLIQFPASSLGKAVKDDLRAWAPATHVGDQDPGSWFQTGSDLAIMVI